MYQKYIHVHVGCSFICFEDSWHKGFVYLACDLSSIYGFSCMLISFVCVGCAVFGNYYSLWLHTIHSLWLSKYLAVFLRSMIPGCYVLCFVWNYEIFNDKHLTLYGVSRSPWKKNEDIPRKCNHIHCFMIKRFILF